MSLRLAFPPAAAARAQPLLLRPQRRTFFDFPDASVPQRFTATRRLPHAPKALYKIVSDIDSYRHFLPYCLGSQVTARCPHTNAPTEADLRVGWGQFDETFRSTVTCRPEHLSVEADASQNPLFQKLCARWEIAPAEDTNAAGGSDVKLHVEFKFTNPLYSAVSGAFVPKVAGVMVEAFEQRAKEVLEKIVENKKGL
ncbi:cyclase/dehydrase family protein [Sphaerosporella brunnea]|uniref:Cyclase/dehydrase family protein n=1 Tax=Sphaerosporella brunnea TaxID=1250544 RepID=A0A5J5ETF0_9PEZI|nr:cyclase/dehydrase family protein [Sphaerosporella brunnea]KAA8903195.1 cyclase/dehydrase family protein [Sphaerosporella brunnea]